MSFVYPILFIVLFLYYDYNNTHFFVMILAYLIPGARISGSIRHKYLSHNMTTNQINGEGGVQSYMASMRHIRIYLTVILRLEMIP